MVNSFFPSDGSIFGGTQVLVTGKGFTEHSIVKVFADDRPCIAIKARFPKKSFKNENELLKIIVLRSSRVTQGHKFLNQVKKCQLFKLAFHHKH